MMLDVSWFGRRVLVTGATGFLGTRLACRLAASGARVLALGRKSGPLARLALWGCTPVAGDLRSAVTRRKIVAEQEVVFHCAAHPVLRRTDGEEAAAVNVQAAAALAECAGDAGVRRFIHVSSIAVYGPPRDRRLEETLLPDTRQRSIYGRTKAEGELQVRQVASAMGLPFVVLRPAPIYGPGAPGLTWFLQLIRRGIPVIYGAGEGLSHLVYIDNLVDALLLCGSKTAAIGQVFNVKDVTLPWQALVATWGQCIGVRPRAIPRWAAAVTLSLLGYLRRQDPGWAHSILALQENTAVLPADRIHQMLGWSPRVSLAEGIARVSHWFAVLHRDGTRAAEELASPSGSLPVRIPSATVPPEEPLTVHRGTN